MSKILGGGTTASGELVYYSRKYEGRAKYNKNTNEIETNIYEYNGNDYLFKIPFIRGLLGTIMQGFIKGETLVIDGRIIGLVVLYLIERFVFKNHYHILDVTYFLYYCYIFFYISKNVDMKALHGSEHLIANYYDKRGYIDIKDIEDIKKESILHYRCGSVFYSFQLLITYLLIFITQDFLIRLILTICIVGEISHYSDEKITKIIFYPLFKIGMFIQKLFFVIEPKDNDIKLAVELVHAIEKAEKNLENEVTNNKASNIVHD